MREEENEKTKGKEAKAHRKGVKSQKLEARKRMKQHKYAQGRKVKR